MSTRRISSAGFSGRVDSVTAVRRESAAAATRSNRWSAALTTSGLHARFPGSWPGTGMKITRVAHPPARVGTAMDLDAWKPYAAAMQAYHRGKHDAVLVVYDDFERDEVP